MEGFEHVVKVALETEDLIVASNLKFPVARKTKKQGEVQTHGYEVDLVGANHEKLVLASVKSFFGSAGVCPQGFVGLSDSTKSEHHSRYLMFNDLSVQQGIIDGAAKKFRYHPDQIELRLYVGKFRNQAAKLAICTHLSAGKNGFRPVKVVDLDEIIQKILGVLEKKTYFNDPVVMTLKALNEAKRLNRS